MMVVVKRFLDNNTFMNKTIFLLLMLVLSFTGNAQINMADSTVQVIGYWSIDDTQSYEVSLEKYKIKDGDTSARNFIKYEVDITIKDSTADSYLIEWFYKNYEIETDNELLQKLSKISEDLPVIIKTDEFGAIQEVINWEEVGSYMEKAMGLIQVEFGHFPNFDQTMAQFMGAYKSKAAIEGNAIKDALQFYTYHGGAYTLNEEINGQMQLMNNFGGAPFDTEVAVVLDEIDEESGSSIIRMFQEVNSEQLTNATYDFLETLTGLKGKLPARENFPALTNKSWTASRIHAATGWTTYSIETKEVHAEGTTNVEERIIQIK